MGVDVGTGVGVSDNDAVGTSLVVRCGEMVAVNVVASVGEYGEDSVGDGLGVLEPGNGDAVMEADPWADAVVLLDRVTGELRVGLCV